MSFCHESDKATTIEGRSGNSSSLSIDVGGAAAAAAVSCENPEMCRRHRAKASNDVYYSALLAEPEELRRVDEYSSCIYAAALLFEAHFVPRKRPPISEKRNICFQAKLSYTQLPGEQLKL